MKLTIDQIGLIKRDVDLNISIPTLGDDLIDHLVCDIETRLDSGESFESAMKSAMKGLAPHGLKEIQKETLMLLNTNFLMMKKLTFATGLLSSMMMAAGWTMSILHLPGAGNFYTVGMASYGFMAFTLLFLPLAVITHFKSNPSMPRHEKLRLIAGLVSGVIATIAMVLKILHMPGANISLLAGTVIFTFWFLPALFYSMYKKTIA